MYLQFTCYLFLFRDASDTHISSMVTVGDSGDSLRSYLLVSKKASVLFCHSFCIPIAFLHTISDTLMTQTQFCQEVNMLRLEIR